MSDILIRGMEMPETGSVTVVICEDGTVINASSNVPAIRQGYRAVELPAHGDLISRDEAVSVLQNIGSRDYRREKGTICDAIKMISHSQYVPTIVPASEEATNDPQP